MPLYKLHPRLQDYVKDKWKSLTPIQEKAFDPIYQGISCTIEAPTSGGKTEAVLFPLLTRISERKSSGFRVLYIVPLKALLNDLSLRVIPYAKMCYMEAFKWHGDVSQGEKVQQMLFPSDILLTTPESIEAIMLRKSNWAEVFSNLETIVVDEAHYFALTERGSHLISLLERMQAALKHRPQRIAVTATIGNPDILLEWLLNGRMDGQNISIANTNDKIRDFKVFFLREEVDLQNQLYKLLIQKKSIVFERSRSDTEDTATQINQRNTLSDSKVQIKVRTHHSSVSKRLREEAETSIKQNAETSLDAIISTSTLELGIDIGDLDQVIQVGSLNSSSSFLQRVGRTGRRPGRSQFFRGLCCDEDELLLLAGCVSLGWRRIPESILFPKTSFHILAHQIICICLQNNGSYIGSIWETISKPYCFSKITRTDFDILINWMVDKNYLRQIEGNILLTGDQTEQEYLRGNWMRLFAIFDTGSMYNVVNGKKIIGTLDSSFARAQQLPFVFVLGGQEWNTKKIDHELQQIVVEQNKTGMAPKWKALASFDIPFELAQEVGRLLMAMETLEFLDASAQNILHAHRNAHQGLNWDNGKWILESSFENTKIYLWTFAGDKINRALASLLAEENDTNTEFNYMKITIGQRNENPLTLNDINSIILALKSKTQSELELLCEKQIPPKWFSKFSPCLPDSLSIKSIREKGMDIVGLLREIKKIRVEISNTG